MRRTGILALEELDDGIETDPNQDQSLSAMMDGMIVADQDGDAAIAEAFTALESHSALKAISRQISKNKSEMNPLTAKFANLAIEGFCSDAKIDMKNLPLDVKGMNKNKDEAIKNGVIAIEELTRITSSKLTSSLAYAIMSVSDRRTFFLSELKRLDHRVDELREGLDNPTEPVLAPGTSPHSQPISDIVGELRSLVIAHKDAMIRLMKDQVHWLDVHRGKFPESMYDYKFDLSNYAFFGGILERFTSGSSNSIYRRELTTGYSLSISGSDPEDQLCDGLSNLKSFKVSILKEPSKTNSIFDLLMTSNLDRNEISLITEEVVKTIAELRHWGKEVYRGIWKDALFELFWSDRLSADDRGASDIREFTLALMDKAREAPNAIGDHALMILDQLLSLAEKSMDVLANSSKTTSVKTLENATEVT